MSGMNGDKSRFHRNRKQKIARRQRNAEMMKKLSQHGKASATSTITKEKTV